MDKVFTKEAMLACSLFGQPSKSKGSARATVRTALDTQGVNAIMSEYNYSITENIHITIHMSYNKF